MSFSAVLVRGKQIVLFIVVVMGAILHGISVAGAYAPALARVRSFLTQIVR